MDVSRPSSETSPSPIADSRLQPNPDYGTLGPASDVATGGRDAQSSSISRNSSAARPLFAIAMGVVLAVLVAGIGNAHAAWVHFAGLFSASPPRQVAGLPGLGSNELDLLQPQEQAETLLEQAVGRSDGAVEQISSRADRWRGKLKWDSQLATLSTAALNSSDARVRESGVEVELAAYALEKNSASLDSLVRTADSRDHARKVWALWALGLMGNRGVETNRVLDVLNAHLKDSDEDSRRWAVEGLALTGATRTIPTLLAVMRDDPAPSVRERAACGLAESGMFTPQQRWTAVPLLLSYTDDPSLDCQTNALAFQALGDITHQRLPNAPAAWRSWYENQGPGTRGQ